MDRHTAVSNRKWELWVRIPGNGERWYLYGTFDGDEIAKEKRDFLAFETRINEVV